MWDAFDKHCHATSSDAICDLGKKGDSKEYQHYTGYPSGRRVLQTSRMRERRPNDIVTLAVRRMLPKNRLGHTMLKNLIVYPADTHAHSAQNPVLVEEL